MMTDKLPDIPALPVSLLRKKSNRSISGRKRKHRLYNPDKRELFMESPEKSNDEIDNKPTEERRTVIYVTNKEFFTGVDEKYANEIDPLAQPSHRRSLRLRQRKELLLRVLFVSDAEVVMIEDMLEVEENQIIKTDFNSVFTSQPQPMDESNSISRVRRKKIKDDRMWECGGHSQSGQEIPPVDPHNSSINNCGGIVLAEEASKSKILRKPYSVKEEAAIIEFLLTKGGYNIIRGKRIWKEMESASICPGRSGLALREHFLKHTLKRLEYFHVTEEQLQEADKNSKHTRASSLFRYGQTHGLRGFRPGAKYYTEEEDRVIMEFIIKNGYEDVVGGNHVWKLMMERNILEGRTWQSLKERFYRSVFNRLDFFDLTPELKKKLEERKSKRRKRRKV